MDGMITPVTLFRLGVMPTGREFREAVRRYREDVFKYPTLIGLNEKYAAFDNERSFLFIVSYDGSWQCPPHSYNVTLTITSGSEALNEEEREKFERMSGISLHHPKHPESFVHVLQGMNEVFPVMKKLGRVGIQNLAREL